MIKSYIQCLINTYKRELDLCKMHDSNRASVFAKVVNDLGDLVKYIDSCETGQAITIQFHDKELREVLNNVEKTTRRQRCMPKL